MKKQDLIAVVVLAAIVATLGILSLDTFFTSPSEKFNLSTEPERVPAGFSDQGKEYLLRQEIQDFTVTVDGVEASKNSTPFGN